MGFENHTLSQVLPSQLFGDLPILRLKFEVAFHEAPRLPNFLGSAWRGLLGWQLRKLVCPFDRAITCKSCTIKNHCPYFLLIERESRAPGLTDSPKGYVLYGTAEEASDQHSFEITLIGDCSKFIPVVSKAIYEGRSVGIGTDRQPFVITRWLELQPGGHMRNLPLEPEGYLQASGPYRLRAWLESCSLSGSEEVTIGFPLPLRLRKKGVYLTQMDWLFFLGSIVRRLEALNHLFNGGSLIGREKWQKILNAFDGDDKMDTKLHWQELKRYSNRQKRKVPMGGLVGHLTHRPKIPETIQWWHAAELVHVGKGAAMGLGRVEVIPGEVQGE